MSNPFAEEEEVDDLDLALAQYDNLPDDGSGDDNEEDLTDTQALRLHAVRKQEKREKGRQQRAAAAAATTTNSTTNSGGGARSKGGAKGSSQATLFESQQAGANANQSQGIDIESVLKRIGGGGLDEDDGTNNTTNTTTSSSSGGGGDAKSRALLAALLAQEDDDEDDGEGVMSFDTAGSIDAILFGGGKAAQPPATVKPEVTAVKEEEELITTLSEQDDPQSFAATVSGKKYSSTTTTTTTTTTASSSHSTAPTYKVEKRNASSNGPAEIKLKTHTSEFDTTGTSPVVAASAGQQQQAPQEIRLSDTHAFYWIDAKEMPHHSHHYPDDKGSVTLFGKLVKLNAVGGPSAPESCCVRVHNIKRSVLLRAMPGSDENDVFGEIVTMCNNFGITKFSIKPVMRYFVFEEPEVTAEKREVQQWYKLTYSAALAPLSLPFPVSGDTLADCPPLAGYQFINYHVGANRNLRELMLIKRRINRGPCFLYFNSPKSEDDDAHTKYVPRGTSRISHCKHEFICEQPKSLSVWGEAKGTKNTPAMQHPPSPTPPTLSGMSIQLLTQLNPAGNKNEIYGICIATIRNGILPDGGKKQLPPVDHKIAIRPFAGDSSLPIDLEMYCDKQGGGMKVIRQSNEEQLLFWLLEEIAGTDPDILLGHNFISFALDVLLHRMREFKINMWSFLGRLRQPSFAQQFPQLQAGAGGMRESTFQEKECCWGRLLIDTYLLAREHYKSTNYKLLSLGKELGLQGIFSTGITQAMIDEKYDQGPQVNDNEDDDDEQQQNNNATATTQHLTSQTMTNNTDLLAILGRQLNAAIVVWELAYRLDVIPLTKQLCSQAGSVWSRVLLGSRSERIEYLLLHAFHAQKHITPDKASFASKMAASSAAAAAAAKASETIGTKRARGEEGTTTTGGAEDAEAVPEYDESAATAPTKRQSKYKGGLVLEPKAGLYTNYVLLLDFNSLYPSLIQEFHVCFSTVNRSAKPGFQVTPPLHSDLKCRVCVDKGAEDCPHKRILPRTIERLVESRRAVKQLMKHEKREDVYAQLDIRQLAIKLTANSMYGCLGFEHSRFFARPLAELVTSQGRETLQNTQKMVPGMVSSVPLEVIYGDTDSVMLATGVKDDLAMVRALGNEVKAAVNKKYRKLEIDIDGVFRSILLMKKKKYAALAVKDWEGQGKVFEQIVKGLDMVRRDWCALSQQASGHILTRILNPQSPAATTTTHLAEGAVAPDDEEDVLAFVMEFMSRLASNVRSGTVYELEKFIINKSLTKEPEAYKGDSFPHASVAVRMKSRNIAVRVGDLIPYIICTESSGAGGEIIAATGGSGSKLSTRAFHVDEVRKEPSKLHIDVEWYLSTQIFPPILRICEYITGFSAQQLAEAMKLSNSSSYAGVVGHDGMAGSGGGVNATGAVSAYDTQYLRHFRTMTLEECFPTAVPIQAKCPQCKRMTGVQPHNYIQTQMLPLFMHRCQERQFLLRSGGLSEDKRRSILNEPIMKPFPLYVCECCHSTLTPQYVANVVTLHLRTKVRAFYQEGGRVADLSKIQAQLSYLRALFDVPHLPGVSPSLTALHRCCAERCIFTDPSRPPTTLEVMAAHTKRQALDEDIDVPIDPVFEAVDRVYRQVSGLRVDLGSIFGL